MKSIMERSPHESSFSFSRRYLQRRRRKMVEQDEEDGHHDNEEEGILPFASSDQLEAPPSDLKISSPTLVSPSCTQPPTALSRVRSAFSVFSKSIFPATSSSSSLGSRVTVTIFGHRRGHVHFAIQGARKAIPEFIIEMSTQTKKLVQEMASGMVRIALETDMKLEKKAVPLLDEPLWRAYCNGRSCGYALRKECGVEEWEVMKVVESISMGAGVLPTRGGGDDNNEGEIMYMRAKFERVAGSRHSLTFYMMNPDRNGGPELSIYLLRV